MSRPPRRPLAERWRVPETVEYIISRGHSVVTLQFPDELLDVSVSIARAVERGLEAQGHGAKVYVLADSTFSPLGVDEIAAEHVLSSCVVHYGRASLQPTSRTPVFFVLPPHDEDVDAEDIAGGLAGCEAVLRASEGSPLVVLLDQPLLSLRAAAEARLRDLLEASGRSQAARDVLWAAAAAEAHEPADEPIPGDDAGGAERGADEGGAGAAEARGRGGSAPAPGPRAATGGDAGLGAGHASASASCAGYVWPSPGAPAPAGGVPQPAVAVAKGSDDEPTTPSTPVARFCWVGDRSAPALRELLLSNSTKEWWLWDPRSSASPPTESGVPREISLALRRRYAVVERARDARVVGLLAGTMSTGGYAEALREVRLLATRAGKKAYTLLIGKPNPAKLANFPEVDVFVLVAEGGDAVLESKDYMVPILTPYEARLAFDEGAPLWDVEGYRMGIEGAFEAGRGGAGSDGAEGAGRPGVPARRAPRTSLWGGSHLIDAGDTERWGDASDGEEVDASEGGKGSGDEGGLPVGRPASAGSSAAQPGGGGQLTVDLLAEQARDALVLPAVTRTELLAAGKNLRPDSAAEYLALKRTWRGVETPQGGAEVLPTQAATVGRSGRAAGYADEPEVGTRLGWTEKGEGGGGIGG